MHYQTTCITVKRVWMLDRNYSRIVITREEIRRSQPQDSKLQMRFSFNLLDTRDCNLGTLIMRCEKKSLKIYNSNYSDFFFPSSFLSVLLLRCMAAEIDFWRFTRSLLRFIIAFSADELECGWVVPPSKKLWRHSNSICTVVKHEKGGAHNIIAASSWYGFIVASIFVLACGSSITTTILIIITIITGNKTA